MMNVKVSKDNKLADGLIERASSMLGEIATKTENKDEKGDRYKEKELGQ